VIEPEVIESSDMVEYDESMSEDDMKKQAMKEARDALDR